MVAFGSVFEGIGRMFVFDSEFQRNIRAFVFSVFQGITGIVGFALVSQANCRCSVTTDIVTRGIKHQV